MVKLSTLILTKNEERNIEQCIKSVLEVSDEIIVVDSFSTDNTEHICKQFNVRFYKNEFRGYASQRNFAVSKASHNYMLFIDADEELSEELIISINTVKTNWNYDGYYVKRLVNYCGRWIKHCGWYPDKKIRLYKSDKGHWKGEWLHEELQMNKHATLGNLKGDLYHYSYHSIGHHVSLIEKYSDLSAADKFEKGKKISILFIIVRFIYSFIYRYFIRLGILDGYYGFVICMLSAYGNFIKDIKLKELNKK